MAIADVVLTHLPPAPSPSPLPSQIHKSSGPHDALTALLHESHERWVEHEPVTDDTTIVIAALKV